MRPFDPGITNSERMKSRILPAILVASAFLATTFFNTAWSQEIDDRSYQLGILGGFSEVVRLGVKKLALSEVLSPGEMDAMMADALVIAERNEVQMWREANFLVTDLYPADVAVGKHVLLIYTGKTLDEYLQLKSDKQALVASGKYSGQAREEIARRFGRMLSYPDNVINDLIAKQTNSN
jgi:hypothetical protein